MIDPNKTYRTRDGREVRIYAVDGFGVSAIHGAVLNNNAWQPECWCKDGRKGFHADQGDLIEVRPKRTLDVWLLVEKDGTAEVYYDIKPNTTVTNPIACLHIVREYEEGEGL